MIFLCARVADIVARLFASNERCTDGAVLFHVLTEISGNLSSYTLFIGFFYVHFFMPRYVIKFNIVQEFNGSSNIVFFSAMRFLLQVMRKMHENNSPIFVVFSYHLICLLLNFISCTRRYEASKAIERRRGISRPPQLLSWCVRRPEYLADCLFSNPEVVCGPVCQLFINNAKSKSRIDAINFIGRRVRSCGTVLRLRQLSVLRIYSRLYTRTFSVSWNFVSSLLYAER